MSIRAVATGYASGRWNSLGPLKAENRLGAKVSHPSRHRGEVWSHQSIGGSGKSLPMKDTRNTPRTATRRSDGTQPLSQLKSLFLFLFLLFLRNRMAKPATSWQEVVVREPRTARACRSPLWPAPMMAWGWAYLGRGSLKEFGPVGISREAKKWSQTLGCLF